MVGRVEPGWEQCVLCAQVERLRNDPDGPRDGKGNILPGWFMVLRPISDEEPDDEE